MRLLPLITVALLLAFLAPAYAVDAPDNSDQAKHDKEVIEKISHIVHDHMAGAMVSNGHIITDDEAKKLKYPLIPYEERKQVVIVGQLSGLAKLCGLDWKSENYLPLMSALRVQHKDWTDYQFAYAGMLHGLSMELGQRGLDAAKVCTDSTKQKLKQSMIFKDASGK